MSSAVLKNDSHRNPERTCIQPCPVNSTSFPLILSADLIQDNQRDPT
ncbi:hypothetical protein N9V88_02165 [bacterium]|nr:hypothetical protein [bacterium]